MEWGIRPCPFEWERSDNPILRGSGDHSIPTLSEMGGSPLHSEGRIEFTAFLRKMEVDDFLLNEVGIRPCPLEWEWTAISIIRESGDHSIPTLREMSAVGDPPMPPRVGMECQFHSTRKW